MYNDARRRHYTHKVVAILRFIRPERSSESRKALAQDLRFDYRVAQVSIFIDISAYLLTLISPTSAQVLFICFTSLSSFTSGANPAIHALAVSYLFVFHNDHNVGRMFGGMSMLQAISNTLQVNFGLLHPTHVSDELVMSKSRCFLDSFIVKPRVLFRKLSLPLLRRFSLRLR